MWNVNNSEQTREAKQKHYNCKPSYPQHPPATESERAMLVIFVTPCLTVTHLDSAEPCNRERVHPIFSDLFSRLARRLFPPQPMANATRESECGSRSKLTKRLVKSSPLW